MIKRQALLADEREDTITNAAAAPRPNVVQLPTLKFGVRVDFGTESTI